MHVDVRIALGNLSKTCSMATGDMQMCVHMQAGTWGQDNCKRKRQGDIAKQRNRRQVKMGNAAEACGEGKQQEQLCRACAQACAIAPVPKGKG